ncbi:MULTISPECIES: hypothetical protein [Streptomyces albovinaceus subgroup]|uniref:hypothetical protein n=1 Tax=Streptomyces albovinaceus subgroup TaxID=1482558 RepID=UPI000AF2DAE0|nr:hypothetical protein [Streptomyces mediolani]
MTTNRPVVAQHYLLVQVDGTLTFHRDTFQVMREKIDQGEGETDMQSIPNSSAITAYHYVPFDAPEQQRMNKVANGIFWELSKPDPDSPTPEPFEPYEQPEPHDPQDRIIKMRGPVVFCARFDSLSSSHADTIRTAHERVHERLRSKGWI